MKALETKLIEKFKQKFKGKLFSYGDARNFGISRYRFYALLRNGEFELIESRQYCLKQHASISLDEQFKDYSKVINGKSAICLITALSYYGLSDEIVTKPWFLVEHKKVEGLQKKNIHLFRKRDPKWQIGIKKKNGFFITSIERSIVECLAYKKTITGYEGVYALRKAIQKKLIKLDSVYDIAEKLGYMRRVSGILEAYLDEGA